MACLGMLRAASYFAPHFALRFALLYISILGKIRKKEEATSRRRFFPLKHTIVFTVEYNNVRRQTQ